MRNKIILSLSVLAIVVLVAFTYLIKPTVNHKEAKIGGAFTLTDQNGQTKTEKDLLGKYSIVFFGFTNCPDVCPTGLTVISQAMKDLGSKASNITPVFITVDPNNDKPEVLKNYLSNFYPDIIGLTGNETQIKQVQDAYKVFSAKVEQPSAPHGYSMDHSAFIYLMDKNGKYVSHFSYNDPAEKIINFISPLL